MNETKRQMQICMMSALKAAAQLTSAMIDAGLFKPKNADDALVVIEDMKSKIFNKIWGM